MTSLLAALPETAGHWAPSNAFRPSSIGANSTKPVRLVCAECGKEYVARPVNLKYRKHPWLCRPCADRRGGGNRKGVAVVCIDTGEEFPSLTDAARWLCQGDETRMACCMAGMNQSLARGCRVRGYRFAYADSSRGRRSA